MSPPVPRRTSLRARIMLPMILLAALALVLAGVVSAFIQHNAIISGIDDQLEGTRDELRVLATQGVDPSTGQPFTTPSALLRSYLARSAVVDAAGEMAIVDGKVAWVSSSDVPVRPENDAQLVEEVKVLAEDDESVIRTLATDSARYRALVVPVQFPGSTGALVTVYDLGLAEAGLRQTMLVYSLTGLITLLLVALASWRVVGTVLRPIEELRRATEAIGERDLATRVPVTGHDELARLSSTVNLMLDRVQRAVEGQRNLLDDVGHELRTPITVVRGHLELVDASDPDDVAQTRDLALDELDRMGVLVNDLLMLAKSTESDFVNPTWTDLAVLTDQVAEKARALGARAWRLASVADAEAWLDPLRITQAWLQLAANAVKYSEEGSPVSIGSRLHRGEVHLWVADVGIGIAPEELDRVRERFGRARNAPDQQHGAGLGLSIVESIVGAHGGRLDIESETGAGSTFTLVLPLGPAVDPMTRDDEA